MNRLPPHDVTRLLHAAHDGDAEAFDALYALVYDELYRLARVVRQRRAGETLNTTALVHEAYLQLIPSRDLAWNDRSHFFAVAARAMRQVLMRSARKHATAKRGGGAPHTLLDGKQIALDDRAADLLVLDEALERLAALDERLAQVVELRFFGGLTIEETAVALGVSTPTVKRDWLKAKGWLYRELRAA